MTAIVVPKNKRKLRKGYVWQKYYTIGVRHISRADFAVLYGNSMEEVMRQRDKWTNEVEGFIHRRAEQLGLEIHEIRAAIVKQPKEGTLEQVYWENHDDIMVWVVHALLLGPVLRECQSKTEMPMVGFYPKDIRDIINKSLNMQDPNNPLNVTHISLAEAEKIDVPILSS